MVRPTPSATAATSSSGAWPQILMRGARGEDTLRIVGPECLARALDVRGALGQRHLDRPPGAVAQHLDGDLVALLLAGDRRGQVLRRADRPAVPRGDDVAPELDRVAAELGGDVPSTDAGLVGGPAGGDRLHEHAVIARQVASGEGLVDRHGLDAEAAAGDPPRLLKLR